MTATGTDITGRCLCGAVRFRSTAAPLTTRYCWCRDCQKTAGGAALVNVIFPSETAAFEGETAVYESLADSGNRMRRRFCPTCGTTLSSQSEARPHLIVVRAGVLVDIVDVGGGFPSIYPGMVPPDMADYVDSIQRGFAEMMVHEDTELWCEPGRALVAEASSILTKVELKKGDALYLNDGSYGSLFDAAHTKWPFPVKLFRGAESADDGEALEVEGPLKPFRFYGPTCDSLDHMPGPFWLPEDVREGDYIEIGMLGAYGVAMNTRFNGFGDAETAVVEDAPMASMFGLAGRTIRLPREAQEEERNKVVRLSRPKGRAGKSRRKR